MNCQIFLKFGMWVHYELGEVEQRLKWPTMKSKVRSRSQIF